MELRLDLLPVVRRHQRELAMQLRQRGSHPVVNLIDHVGMQHFQRDTQRVQNVVQLVAEGHTARLLLSHDVCYKHLLHWYHGPGYDHLLTTFVPALRAAGVSEADVHTILVENPRRILAYDI